MFEGEISIKEIKLEVSTKEIQGEWSIKEVIVRLKEVHVRT